MSLQNLIFLFYYTRHNERATLLDVQYNSHCIYGWLEFHLIEVVVKVFIKYLFVEMINRASQYPILYNETNIIFINAMFTNKPAVDIRIKNSPLYIDIPQ